MTDKEKLAIIKDLIADALDSRREYEDTTSQSVTLDEAIRDARILTVLMEQIEDVIEDRPFDLNQQSAASN